MPNFSVTAISCRHQDHFRALADKNESAQFTYPPYIAMDHVKLRIQDLADVKGWTLEEVANRAGVQYETVQDYSRNILSTVDLSIVYRIARALEVTLEDLVEVLEN